MGECAEMMLDGTMCAGCGEWLHDGEDGDGYPGYCESCAPDYEEDEASKKTFMKKLHKELTDSQKPKSPEAMQQSIIDKVCSAIVYEMGGKKMSRKSRKNISRPMRKLLTGWLNVDGLIVHKEFEEMGIKE